MKWRKQTHPADLIVEPAAVPPAVFGYECPGAQDVGFDCHYVDSDADEEALLRRAWAHASTCSHAEHAEARDADPTYGHHDHFHYERRDT